MRLLVITQYFWPETFRINDLVTELARRGHDVVVLTGQPNYPEGEIYSEYLRDPSSFMSYHGAEIVRVPISPRKQSRLSLMWNYATFALSAAIVGALKLRGRNFDCIFVYEPSPITVGLPAAVLRTIKKAPVAFWVLDLWPDTLEALGVLRSQRLLRAVGSLVSFIYKRCDLILVQSQAFIPQIAKYAGDAPIRYFPSWSEPLPSELDSVLAPEVPNAESTFDVLFAGNIGESQDFPAVLDAAEILRSHRQIRWLIVGDGRMGAWVRAEVAKRGLQNNFLMLGRYPVERMASFYYRAHALLVSLQDKAIFSMTIPAKLQSYLAAGRPVIAMINGEGAKLVESSSSGMTCRAGDSRGLANCVLKLASSPPGELARMGLNASQLSQREFDRATLISRLEEWLVSLKLR